MVAPFATLEPCHDLRRRSRHELIGLCATPYGHVQEPVAWTGVVPTGDDGDGASCASTRPVPSSRTTVPDAATHSRRGSRRSVSVTVPGVNVPDGAASTTVSP